MDTEGLDFPYEDMLSCLDMLNPQSISSYDDREDLEKLLDPSQTCNGAVGRTEACTDALGRTQTCTHAHACNPLAPDKSHTHTCIHIHREIMPDSGKGNNPSDDTVESMDKKCQKRPSGNREAVRKYREKKKAKAASLEDEVARLRAMNQQLMKRLHNQALLEAEVTRLKCLLIDIQGRIGGVIGSFPYQKPVKDGDDYQNVPGASFPGTHVMNPCNMQNNDSVHCLQPGSENALNGQLSGQGFGDCGFDDLQCLGDQSSFQKELLDSGLDSINCVSKGTSTRCKGRGARAATAS